MNEWKEKKWIKNSWNDMNVSKITEMHKKLHKCMTNAKCINMKYDKNEQKLTSVWTIIKWIQWRKCMKKCVNVWKMA